MPGFSTLPNTRSRVALEDSLLSEAFMRLLYGVTIAIVGVLIEITVNNFTHFNHQ